MKQEGFSSEAHDCSYSQGDIVKDLTVKDVPAPNDLLENGRRKLPVAFVNDFVVILSEYPTTLKVGDSVDVVLLKITKSHSHKNMAFGAVRGE